MAKLYYKMVSEIDGRDCADKRIIFKFIKRED